MIWSAFILGLAGSLHCIGMCGPIALLLPIPNGKNRTGGIVVYNFGRITTYGILGAILGGIGSLFFLAGWQQYLSIVIGSLLILFTYFYFSGRLNLTQFNPFRKFINSLKSNLGRQLKINTYSSLYFIGFLNGLLPCGLVYAALIGAVAVESPLYGSYFMMLFGLGTAPAMIAVGLFKSNVSNFLRARLIKAVPFTIVLAGLLLILRGMNLGIPYVSPSISVDTSNKATCCTKVKCH